MILKSITKTCMLSTLLGLSANFANADGHVAYLNSGSVLPTNLPFSELVVAGDTLYLSGQIGNVPGTLDLAEGGMTSQSRQVMDNIKTSL